MANVNKFDAVIESVSKRGISGNGSPTYTLHLTGGATVNTNPDSALNYSISNAEYLNVPVTIETRDERAIYVTIKN